MKTHRDRWNDCWFGGVVATSVFHIAFGVTGHQASADAMLVLSLLCILVMAVSNIALNTREAMRR